MTLTRTETADEVCYEDRSTCVVVKKDENVVDVRQVTPVADAGGQTWQSLCDFLDTKVGL